MDVDVAETAFDAARSAFQDIIDICDKFNEQTEKSVIKTNSETLRCAKNVFCLTASKFIQELESARHFEAVKRIVKTKTEYIACYDVLKEQLGNLYDSGESVLCFSVCNDIDNASQAMSEYETRDAANVTHRKKMVLPSLNPEAPVFAPTVVDPSTALATMIMKKDLFSTPPKPFDGSPEGYRAWKQMLKHRVTGCGLLALDELYLLEISTRGDALSLVRSFTECHSSDPETALKEVWLIMDERYGRSEAVARSIRKRLNDFPPVSRNNPYELRKLSDLCMATAIHVNSIAELHDLNYSHGLELVRRKLPEWVALRWRKFGVDYERRHHLHPPFSTFCKFLSDVADEVTDQGFSVLGEGRNAQSDRRSDYRTALAASVSPTADQCPLHNSMHCLDDCYVFRAASVQERRKILSDHQRCFRCFGSGHRAKFCEAKISCKTCRSVSHNSLLHESRPVTFGPPTRATTADKTPAQITNPSDTPTTVLNCTGPENAVFGKVFLVEITAPLVSSKSVTTYAVVDEGSNTTFVDPRVVESLGVKNTSDVRYSLKTLADRTQVERVGQRVEGLAVRGIREPAMFSLPAALTSTEIPDVLSDLASPSVVKQLPHLSHLASNFNEVNVTASVTVLIGRDAGALMLSECYGDRAPYAHHTPLGWALVGPVNGERSRHESYHACVLHTLVQTPTTPCVFSRESCDDLPGLSIEDRNFLDLMDRSTVINSEGHVEMPLPFRGVDQFCLPDNESAVRKRMRGTVNSLSKRPKDLLESVKFMDKMITERHVEQIPEEQVAKGSDVYYIPIFPVRHPKTQKLRLVFDSAAQFDGVSLNDALMSGPNLINSLVGVLLRFRKYAVALSADIASMFHVFHVAPAHRDYLRFLWFSGNDPTANLVAYRGRVHIFGNKSSPAAAVYGLRYAAKSSVSVSEVVRKNFYVDDMLLSVPSVREGIDCFQTIIETLSPFGIKIHKVVSNSTEVLSHFPLAIRAETLVDIDLKDAPLQRTLGLQWDVRDDNFVFRSDYPHQPFTKRGVLAYIHSIFDPCGFVAPVILTGRLLLREVMHAYAHLGWDVLIPSDRLAVRWKSFSDSINELTQVKLARCINPRSSAKLTLHGFADASKDAIGFCIYVCVSGSEECTTLLYAGSKVTPRAAGTIPRLELCAALELARSAKMVEVELSIDPKDVVLFTDSRIVLGYLSNFTRRFSVYVSNRVHSILQLTALEQWRHVDSEENPADIATRPTTPLDLVRSGWFVPKLPIFNGCCDEFSLDELPESLNVVCTSHVVVDSPSILHKLFSNVTRWTSLLRIVLTLQKSVRMWLAKIGKVSQCNPSFDSAVTVVARCVQKESGLTVSSDSLCKLSPFADDHGAIRVGGRLRRSSLPYLQNHPLVFSRDHPITELLIEHYHRISAHQGRSVTLGLITDGGFHILIANQIVRQVIRRCFNCRRFRGQLCSQVMSDLPADRLAQSPPFESAGCDVFGPYVIQGSKGTRASVERKVWVLLITCLVSRAVHCEILESMDTVSTLLALRRFQSIRGTCKRLRSDRGTNFVGVFGEAEFVSGVNSRCIEWIPNPPSSSHTGGVWESKIRCVRKVLDQCLTLMHPRRLTFEEFYTYLQEAVAIVNFTPLVSSTEPGTLINPAQLLTLKDSHPPPLSDEICERDVLAYGQRRWRRVNFLSERFWTLWRQTYLQTLQSRAKWRQPTPSLQVGDVVLLRDKSTARNVWPCGTICAIKTSEDGFVRSADVRVWRDGKSSVLSRSIHELVLLHAQLDDN